ncbi:MAG: hypothetical protein U0Y68_20795 [Blastocatellia bacterium]
MQIPELLRIVKQQCDYPDVHRPSEDHFMMAIRKCAQKLHNRLGVALPGWDIRSKDVQAGQNDFVKKLNIDSLGKPRRCYAILAMTDIYAMNCPVKIIDVDELNLYQGNAAIAEVCAPYYSDGDWKIQFAPSLTSTYTYRLWYEVGALPFYGKNDTPIPQTEGYHYLLADMVTVEVLPHCWWSKLLGKEVEMKAIDQKKLMDAHARGLKERCAESIAEQFPVFQEHISTLLATQEPLANGYADQYGEFDDQRVFF